MLESKRWFDRCKVAAWEYYNCLDRRFDELRDPANLSNEKELTLAQFFS
jgi:hypothetical protein